MTILNEVFEIDYFEKALTLIVLFASSWCLVGLVTLLFLIIKYLRKSEYNKKAFKKFFNAIDWFFIIVMGYFAPIIVFIKYISSNLNSKKNNIYEWMYDLLYKIANIGVDKKLNKKEEDGSDRDEII